MTRLSDDLPRAQARVEGTNRVLEDDLDPPPDLSECRAFEVADVPTTESHGTRRRLVEAGEEPTEGRLSRTRLSDQAHGLARPHRNRHAFDRVNHVLRLPLGRPQHGPGYGGGVC